MSFLDKIAPNFVPRVKENPLNFFDPHNIFGKGGAIERMGGKEQDNKAEDALARAEEAYSGLQAPNLSVSDAADYQDMGAYDPALIEGAKLGDARLADIAQAGDSAFSNISVDPRLKDMQMGSISALDDIIKGGGLNDQDRANLARIQSETAQADRGRREAILQNLGARGMSGSGQELLAQLSSSQAASDRSSQAGLDVAGQAQARALQAIQNQGTMAGNLRSQDYGEQQQLAAAKDAISKFNAGNSMAGNLANAASQNQFALQQANMNQNAQQFNAGAQTDAAKYAQANKQDIANQNVGVRNETQQRRDALPQQNFANQNTIAAGKAGAALPAVNYWDSAAGRKEKERSELLSGAISGASKVAAAL